MSLNPQTKLAPDEYLAFERSQTDARHEYLNGEITLMAGASLEHNRIVSNLVASLHAQMRGRTCDVFSGDMRVHILDTGLYAYPDIVALCDEPRLEDNEADILLNPSVIMEVLSPSTEAYDRGVKFDHYRSIDSLQTYVLITQDRPQVEIFQRQEHGDWLFSVTKGLEMAVELNVIDCYLSLADVYERIPLPPA